MAFIFATFVLNTMQLKKFFLLYFFLFTAFSTQCFFAQNKKLDSLWAVYNNKTEADSNRLKAIHAIIWSYIGNDPDTAMVLAEQQLDLAQTSKQKKYEGKALNNIGVAVMLKGNYPKALEYFFGSLKRFEEIRDK